MELVVCNIIAVKYLLAAAPQWVKITDSIAETLLQRHSAVTGAIWLKMH